MMSKISTYLCPGDSGQECGSAFSAWANTFEAIEKLQSTTRAIDLRVIGLSSGRKPGFFCNPSKTPPMLANRSSHICRCPTDDNPHIFKVTLMSRSRIRVSLHKTHVVRKYLLDWEKIQRVERATKAHNAESPCDHRKLTLVSRK